MADSTEKRIAEIEALAKAATKGPWAQSHRKNDHDGMYRTQVYTTDGEPVCTLEWYPIHYEGGTKTAREDNAAFLAAVDPQTIQWLISELRAALAEMKRIMDDNYRLREEHHAIKADRDRLREAAMGLVRVIDAAGLYNLSTGVQLGPTVWFVKASDAMDAARTALQGASPKGQDDEG